MIPLPVAGTRLRLTRRGREALRREVAVLEALVAGIRTNGEADG